MMKKIVFVSMLFMLLVSSAFSEQTKITVEKAGAEYVMQADRGSLTLVLRGPESALTEENARLLLDAYEKGESVTLTDPGFIDAEKASNLVWGGLPGDLGEWVLTDDTREDVDWGDKLLCWAASTSDMLTMSGWNRLAREAFEDEDALFSLFVKSFYNDGGCQQDGIAWFFNGSAEGIAAPKEDGEGYIQAYDPSELCRFYSMDTGNDAFVPLDTARDAILSLRHGAAVGINITLSPEQFPLRGEEEPVYDRDGAGMEMILVEQGEEHLYSYDENGVIILRDGEENDMSMIRGLLALDAEDGRYYPLEEFMDGYCYMKDTRVDPKLLDLSRPYRSMSVGLGGHALTVSGYILENGELAALMITDSDDDAGFWNPPAGQERREDRPNRSTLYPLVRCPLTDGGETWLLTSYAGQGALVCNVTVLEAPKDRPFQVAAEK